MVRLATQRMYGMKDRILQNGPINRSSPINLQTPECFWRRIPPEWGRATYSSEVRPQRLPYFVIVKGSFGVRLDIVLTL